MNGIIFFDKPQNMTSRDACDFIRQITGVKKTGHSGTLDPMATGLLTILLGDYTRIIEYFDDSKKIYEATIKLGLVTDTLDIWGKELDNPFDKNKIVTLEDVQKSVQNFIGETKQIAPAFSAVKVKGKKLYELARSGEKIPVKERTVVINSIDIISYDEEKREIKIVVDCGGRTYIRTLADDIGKDLGVGACISSLRRTFTDNTSIEKAVTFDELANASHSNDLSKYIHDLDESMFKEVTSVALPKVNAYRFVNGKNVELSFIKKSPLVLVYCEDEIIGTGYSYDGLLMPKKVFKK
jgi:tRNA pseudouridine55 synthase